MTSNKERAIKAVPRSPKTIDKKFLKPTLMVSIIAIIITTIQRIMGSRSFVIPSLKRNSSNENPEEMIPHIAKAEAQSETIHLTPVFSPSGLFPRIKYIAAKSNAVKYIEILKLENKFPNPKLPNPTP